MVQWLSLEKLLGNLRYYKAHYCIDDDIYRFCQQLYLFFKDKEYSDTLRTVGIIPIIAPLNYMKEEK